MKTEYTDNGGGWGSASVIIIADEDYYEADIAYDRHGGSVENVTHCGNKISMDDVPTRVARALCRAADKMAAAHHEDEDL